MRATVVEPADVSGAALDELKEWLGISRPNDDEQLTDLLLAGIAMCEAFTGKAPLAQQVEERIPVREGCYTLSSRPVLSLISVEVIAQDGSRVAMDPARFEFELRSDQTAMVNIISEGSGQAIAVQFRSGVASTWETVPAAIKQGLIRFAAFHYRDRDRSNGGKSAGQPPASVIALWRPWRELRLQ